MLSGVEAKDFGRAEKGGSDDRPSHLEGGPTTWTAVWGFRSMPEAGLSTDGMTRQREEAI